MGLSIKTQPSVEPITLADAKLHLRVPSADVSRDAEISTYITAARRMCEKYLRRSLINTTYTWVIDGFPGYVLPALRDPAFFNVIRETQDLIMRLPLGGVSAINSIQYIDASTQTLTTLDPSLYVSSLTDQPARLAPAYSQAWPTALSQIGSVTIEFVSGYGASSAAVPVEIIHAMRLYIGDFNENAENSITGNISGPIQMTAEKLMFDERVWPIQKG